MSALSVSEILNLLKTRRQHCRSLLDLSRGQTQLIEDGDFTGLLAVLGQKQRLLGGLDELNRRHPDLRQRWQELRQAVDPALREECEHVLAEIEAILAELLKEEKGSTDHLTQRRDAAERQLQAVTSGSQVHNAYLDSPAPSTNRHLDVGN